MKTLTLLTILLGVYQVSSQGHKTFLTGGGCAEIPGVGSPILMIANAHKYIENALHVKNNYTVVKYIHHAAIPSTTIPGQTTYKLAFSITDYNGTKYLGIEAVISPFGIGSVKINKFIFTKSLATLKQVIDSTIDETTTFQCGDLKFVYSSFGNDPTPKLSYLFPGRNQNSTGLAILNQLDKTTTKPTEAKTCVTANFVETTDFFGILGLGVPVDLLHCLPNENAIAAIHVGCTGGLVASLQLTFNNLNNPGTTQSAFVGNPATPASDITTISLQGADKVSLTSFSVPIGLQIQTLNDDNTVIQNYTCGPVVGTPENVTVTVDDFLGLTEITTDGAIIESFEITQYVE